MTYTVPALPSQLSPSLRWRIVETNEDGEFFTLFHSINGTLRTRLLWPGVWYQSEQRWATDGSGGKHYWTGFHVFDDKRIALDYLGRFSANPCRIVIPVWTLIERPKPTNSNVKLVNYMYLPDKLCVS